MALPEIRSHRPIIKSADSISGAIFITWEEEWFLGLMRVVRVRGVYPAAVAQAVEKHILAERELQHCPPAKKALCRQHVHMTNNLLPAGLRDPKHK